LWRREKNLAINPLRRMTAAAFVPGFASRRLWQSELRVLGLLRPFAAPTRAVPAFPAVDHLGPAA
ncbi:MAG: hypothetical protein Q8Q09_00700, partial [Deltaproteobacteria bacterium]|nr:hypothetical protein [Deltaproteobacteria bacterium]